MVNFPDALDTPSYPLTDDPDVAHYCRTTGPVLGGTVRLVFRELGRYVNPETGKAWPSMERLAADLEVGKSTISRAVKTLELA